MPVGSSYPSPGTCEKKLRVTFITSILGKLPVHLSWPLVAGWYCPVTLPARRNVPSLRSRVSRERLHWWQGQSVRSACSMVCSQFGPPGVKTPIVHRSFRRLGRFRQKHTQPLQPDASVRKTSLCRVAQLHTAPAFSLAYGLVDALVAPARLLVELERVDVFVLHTKCVAAACIRANWRRHARTARKLATRQRSAL